MASLRGVLLASIAAVPSGFTRAIRPLLAPGTTLFVTDAPILAENTGAGLTVISNGAPD